MRIGICLAAICAAPLWAGEAVNITPDIASVTVPTPSGPVRIARNPDPGHVITGEFARTSRACPPACIQPMRAARGVATMGELEVMDFLKANVSTSTGLLVDARLPADFAGGAIPGAVNVPTETLAPGNPYRPDILRALGARDVAGGQFDFSGALELMVYGDGPWSDTARLMIRNLLDAGYPPEKITYYRAGMQGWVSFGLTTARPQTQG